MTGNFLPSRCHTDTTTKNKITSAHFMGKFICCGWLDLSGEIAIPNDKKILFHLKLPVFYNLQSSLVLNVMVGTSKRTFILSHLLLVKFGLFISTQTCHRVNGWRHLQESVHYVGSANVSKSKVRLKHEWVPLVREKGKIAHRAGSLQPTGISIVWPMLFLYSKIRGSKCWMETRLAWASAHIKRNHLSQILKW